MELPDNLWQFWDGHRMDDFTRTPDSHRVAFATYLPNEKVRLRVEENRRLNLTVGTIEFETSWGASILVSAAGSGRFRALHSEIEKIEDGDYNHVPHHVEAYVSHRGDREISFGVCDYCGSDRLKRTGTCLLCEDCGTSGGC